VPISLAKWLCILLLPFTCHEINLEAPNLVSSNPSKTAKIILVLYWGLGYNRSHIRSMVQYSTNMIFAVLDVSLIRPMGLNIGETDKVFFYINVGRGR